MIWILIVVIELEIQDDLGVPVNYVRIQDLEDNIRKDIVSDKNSLYRAISPVLLLTQYFAILPVQGIREQNTSYLTYVIVYYILIICHLHGNINAISLLEERRCSVFSKKIMSQERNL